MLDCRTRIDARPLGTLRSLEETMDASHEILDAFIDGETVDPATLKQVLSDPAGRDYLIDAWLLAVDGRPIA